MIMSLKKKLLLILKIELQVKGIGSISDKHCIAGEHADKSASTVGGSNTSFLEADRLKVISDHVCIYMQV